MYLGNAYETFVKSFLNFRAAIDQNLIGCMQEWGNHWQKGVECRANVREDIPYAGFFTQLGQLHKVYHIW